MFHESDHNVKSVNSNLSDSNLSVSDSNLCNSNLSDHNVKSDLTALA